MRLETYISDLLYRYQCIVIPGFGAFLSQPQPARIDHEEAVFYPPSKRISFNVQLHSNDGLLAKYIADVEKITYNDALSLITETIKTWETAFQNNEHVSLKNIGELWTNESGNIQFQPSENVNYLASSFGLTPVISTAVTREVLKQEVVAIEEKAPIFFTAEKRKNREYLRYAAIFLLMISVATIGYNTTKNTRENRYETARQQAQEQVEKTIEQATFFDTDPAILPSVTLNVNKANKEVPRYHVVAGAFRIPSNAEKKSRQLLAKGYNARRAGINKYGLHIVSYGSFSNAEDALSFLKTVRDTETPEAWLWVSK